MGNSLPRPAINFALVLFAILSLTEAQINLFATISSDNAISSECSAALNTTINCDSSFQYYPNTDYEGPFADASAQVSFCDSTCSSSLSSYHSDVVSACASDPDPWDGIPATVVGDRLWAYQNRTCRVDPTTGAYCNNVINAWGANLTNTAIQDVPTEYLCSSCYLNWLKAIQSTPYSNYDSSFIASYEAVQSACGVTYPTEVQSWPLSLNETIPAGVNTSSSATSTTCLSGKTYTVQSGDGCNAIAIANNVATGTLTAINGIYRDCTNLIAGAAICLPQTCTTYQVASGDTCFSIASAKSLTFTNILSYNPSLNSGCTNLLAGDNICLSPPSGTYTPTTIAGLTAIATGTYATAIAPSPAGQIADGTTTECGAYYEVGSGDTCQSISLNKTIDVSLFESINPAINENCTNLYIDVYYCVQPLANWTVANNDTIYATSIALTNATNIVTGTTQDCGEWYTVVSGDNCANIAETQGVSLSLFYEINPSLNSDCSNLQLGVTYCLLPTRNWEEDEAPTSVVAAPTSAASDSSTTCYEWHYVGQSENCAFIETIYQITFAQLQAWNPSINDDCTNLLLDESYCVAGPTTATDGTIQGSNNNTSTTLVARDTHTTSAPRASHRLRHVHPHFHARS